MTGSSHVCKLAVDTNTGTYLQPTGYEYGQTIFTYLICLPVLEELWSATEGLAVRLPVSIACPGGNGYGYG